MKKIILASLFWVAAGCGGGGNKGDGVSKPPPEMVGLWGAPVLASATPNPGGPVVDPCDGLHPTSEGVVNTGIYRIDADSKVFDATQVKSKTETYRQIGTLDAQAQFHPTAEFSKEIIGTVADKNPDATFILTGHAELTTEVTVGIAQPADEFLLVIFDVEKTYPQAPKFNQTYKGWETLNLKRVDAQVESAVLEKATNCALSKAKPKP